jgi:hypothetical protein
LTVSEIALRRHRSIKTVSTQKVAAAQAGIAQRRGNLRTARTTGDHREAPAAVAPPLPVHGCWRCFSCPPRRPKISARHAGCRAALYGSPRLPPCAPARGPGRSVITANARPWLCQPGGAARPIPFPGTPLPDNRRIDPRCMPSRG